MAKELFMQKSPEQLIALQKAYAMSILQHNNNVVEMTKLVDEMVFWRNETKKRLRAMEFAYGDLCLTMLEMGLDTHEVPNFERWSIEQIQEQLGMTNDEIFADLEVNNG